MELFNNFINWKKNIKLVQMYELNAVFNLHSNFSLIKSKFNSSIATSIDDRKLANFILSNNFEVGDNFFSDSFMSESYSIVCEPGIGGTVYDRVLNINKYIRLERNINAIQIQSILDTYPENLLNTILKIDPEDLYILIVSNPTSTVWDKATHPISYKFKAGLRTHIDPKSKFKKIDISSRPGRSAELGNFYFKGGFEYYFGEKAYTQIPKKLILNFSDAEEINKLENNIVYVKLFEMDQYWEDFAQDRLSAFRKHLMIDELESRFLSTINKI